MSDVALGRITATHGLKGHVRLHTYSGEGTSLFRNANLKVRLSDGSERVLVVTRSVSFKHCFIVKFRGVDHISDAEPLVKGEVFIRREDMPLPGKDEYYWVDLIGSEVHSIHRGFLGVVSEIIETGSADVLCVQREQKETLLPLTKDLLVKFDAGEKRIEVDDAAFIDED